MFLDPVPNQTQGIDTIPLIIHETHHTTEIETNHIIEIEVIQTIEIKITRTIDQEIIHIIDQTITDQTIIIKTDHKTIHKIETHYNNRYRNYSQSPHRNNNRYPDSKHRYRSGTPKHRRHINQMQTNEETTSDPPGIDDTGSNELQLNQINCGSSDTESDTENTISVNMITVKNDYEPIIYEQPFTSHIYENQLELLHNYYIEPIDNTQTTQEVNGINTVIKPDKKDETQCPNTKHIYQNIQKKQPRENKPQLRKIAKTKRASHPSSIREPDLDFRKLVDKLEQAEITMKLEETENLKLQYVNRIQTNTTHIKNVHESVTDLIEKITEILNIYERNPNFKGKPSFKKWCNYCRRYGHSISECRQKQQDS